MSENNELRISIIVNEFETKEGKKFNAYKAIQANGKLIDCKFTRAVKDLPERNCVIVVNPKNVNIDKNRQFPCIWVKEVIKLEYPVYDNDVDVMDMFSNDVKNEDLPF